MLKERKRTPKGLRGKQSPKLTPTPGSSKKTVNAPKKTTRRPATPKPKNQLKLSQQKINILFAESATTEERNNKGGGLYRSPAVQNLFNDESVTLSTHKGSENLNNQIATNEDFDSHFKQLDPFCLEGVPLALPGIKEIKQFTRYI